MIVFVHNSPSSLQQHRHPNLGILCSPRRVYGNELHGWTWAADNDAYSEWDESRYTTMLDKITGRDPQFVTAPDVVGDWEDTRDLFDTWHPELKSRQLPIAYVLQDGQPHEWIPWDHIVAVFVGGTTDYKMSPQAATHVRTALSHGMWTHMGRVNSLRRMTYAKAIGCTSIDGSQYSWFTRTHLPKALKDASNGQQLMLEETP